MANFAKMGRSPAIPLAYAAAKPAFKLDEFLSMLWAFCQRDPYGRALSTH